MHRTVSILTASLFGLGCCIGIADAANFSDSSIGISIDLDDALSEKSHNRGNIVFSAKDNSAAIYIIPRYELSMYDLGQRLDDGKWRGHGIDLKLTGDEKTADVDGGRGLLVQGKARVGQYKVKGVLGAYAGDNDRGFMVFAAARPDYWNDWKDRIKAMIESIRFIDIDYSTMLTDWEYRVAGMSLAPVNPVSHGQLVPQPINLCSDGTVLDEKPADTQPAATEQTVWNGYAWVKAMVLPPPPIRWSIVPVRGKPTLLLRNGPRPQEFRLEMDGEQLLVNGKPHDITENTVCK